MFKNTLKAHWENLTAELSLELRRLPDDQKTPGRLNDWFIPKAHRFSSLGAIESTQLEQAGSKEFVTAFREKLSLQCFVLPKDSDDKIPPKWVGPAVATVLGVVTFLIMHSLIKTAISLLLSLGGALIVAAGTFTLYHTAVYTKAANQKSHSLDDAYLRQFSSFLDELLKVCDNYGVE